MLQFLSAKVPERHLDLASCDLLSPELHRAEGMMLAVPADAARFGAEVLAAGLILANRFGRTKGGNLPG
jgi:hypothetical protein